MTDVSKCVTIQFIFLHHKCLSVQ